VGAELFHVDGQAKLTVAFRYFSYALNNEVPEGWAISGLLYYDLKATYPVSIKERDSWQLLERQVALKWPSAFYAVLYSKSVRTAPEVFATCTFRVTEFDVGGCFSTPQQGAKAHTNRMSKSCSTD